MMRLPSILLLLALAAVCGVATAAGSSRSGSDRRDSGSSFDAFRIVLDRNIFNSSRRRYQPREQQIYVRQLPPTPVPTDRLSLIGVFINRASSGTEAVAFFSGSRSDYNDTAKLGEMIAGCRVAEIRTDRVRLEKDGRQIDLPISMSVSRRAGGEWQLSSSSGYGSARRSDYGSRRESDTGPREAATTTTVTSQNAEETKSSGGSADDMLKQLMARRRKESGQ